MGLIKNIDLENGLPIVQNSYLRIDTVGGNKTQACIGLKAYASQEAYASGKVCIKQYSETFIPLVDDNSYNFIKQGYEYLKTLDEFKDAVDA